jgi:hypothetical protein
LPLHAVDYVTDLPARFGRGAIAEGFGATQNPFDLSLQQVSFVPANDGFGISRGPATFNPDLGPPLELGFTGLAEFELPFSFPFLGQEHGLIVINAHGTIGFGESCYPTRGQALAFGPCVFVFGRNLQPEIAGSIHASAFADRVVVTWSGVRAPGQTITAQATLYADGRIVLSYPEPIAPAMSALVGVSGGYVSLPIREIDFSGSTSVSVAARTVIEQFGPTFQHFDLLDRHATFVPRGEVFRIESGHGGFDDTHHRDGDRIAVGCGNSGCASVEVPLPFAFPFLGREYEQLFVNSDGSLTLGGADPATVLSPARMLSGPPRVAPFALADEFAQLGRVSAFAGEAGVVITWEAVGDDFVTFGFTWQAQLAPDGTIRFVYSRTPDHGLVGLSAGARAGPLHEIDLTSDHPRPLKAGMIFEAFAPHIPAATIDIIGLAREFYANYPDKFDFLVVFTDFPVDLGPDLLASQLTFANWTRGVGIRNIAGDEVYDDDLVLVGSRELESFVQMNNINIYWPDAARMIDPPLDPSSNRVMGIGDGGPAVRTTGPWTHDQYSPMSMLAHEVGHRWLAYPRFVHPQTGVGADSFDLTRERSARGGHWNEMFNALLPAGQFPGEPRASAMTGRGITDLGGPSFPQGTGFDDCAAGQHAFLASRPFRDGYSALDQYLMGLRTAAEVGPFFYVENPTLATRPQPPKGSPPPPPPTAGGLALCGTRIELSVADIVAHPDMGPRMPALGDEQDRGPGRPDVKTVAFVLLTTSENHEDAVKRVDEFRRGWEWYANGLATGGRGHFDTSLHPKVY